MHIKLCVDPVIPKKERKGKKNFCYMLKKRWSYAFLADLKKNLLCNTCIVAARKWTDSVKAFQIGNRSHVDSFLSSFLSRRHTYLYFIFLHQTDWKRANDRLFPLIDLFLNISRNKNFFLKKDCLDFRDSYLLVMDWVRDVPRKAVREIEKEREREKDNRWYELHTPPKCCKRH